MPTATTTASGVDDVQARIAAIQTRIASLTGQSTSTTSSAAFADTLNQVLGTSNSSTAADALSSASSADVATSGQDVVDVAKQWLGTPYVWGGDTPGKGLDCSGLVQQAFKQLGIDMPRVASDQAKQGTKVNSLAEAKPGDIVAFGSPVDHIGIYAGDNKMVVAPKKGDVVKIQEIYKTPTAIRRIVLDTDSSVSTLSVTSSTGVSSSLSSKYDSLFTAAASKYGISANLLAAVAKQESGFNASAQSGAGAQGLMQIMPATAKSLGVNALDPSQAVDGAAKMLSGLQSKFGSTELALAAYNAGAGAVTKYGGIPPYGETQNYVAKIMASIKGTK